MDKIHGVDMYRAVFDALPSLVFVVDDEVRIYECNAAAENLLRAKSATVLEPAGQVLHCLHATDVPEGCGHAEFCRDCVIRNAVRYPGKPRCAEPHTAGDNKQRRCD